jgi:hypothetical protein
MMRLTTFLLCLLLAAAAAGRYQAEAAVRETRLELRRLDKEKSKELSQIQVLRAEIAYLESPERLSAIAGKMTDLEPLSGAQLYSADDFELAFDDKAASDEKAEAGAVDPFDVAALAAAPAR